MEEILSVRISMTFPQSQSIFFLPKIQKPVFACAYLPHCEHSITNFAIKHSPQIQSVYQKQKYNGQIASLTGTVTRQLYLAFLTYVEIAAIAVNAPYAMKLKLSDAIPTISNPIPIAIITEAEHPTAEFLIAITTNSNM